MSPAPPGPSSRTLFLLTLLGLTGCALIAVTHPPEVYDPARGLEQAGRNLQVDLEITTSRTGNSWARGEALPLQSDGHPHPKRVSWIWFRAPDPHPQPGDRVQGRALLTQDPGGTSLVLDGPRAAIVTPGPVPIPVHWTTLLDQPEPLAGRLLVVNGVVDGDRLRAPDGTATCPLLNPGIATSTQTTWLLRLERDPDQPGWSCRLEGPA